MGKGFERAIGVPVFYFEQERNELETSWKG